MKKQEQKAEELIQSGQPATASAEAPATETQNGDSAAAGSTEDAAEDAAAAGAGSSAPDGAAAPGTDTQKGDQPAAKPKAKTAKANSTAGVETPKSDSELDELVAEYSKLYPKCRKFHIASDRMVFLENDLNAALFHQRSLPDGEVITKNRK